ADYPPHKKAPGLHRGLRSVREKLTYRLTLILACETVGIIGRAGSWGTTSLTQRESLSLKYEVSLALRNASMLSCFVPEAALAKPGSSNMIHESLFISLRLRETSGLSVFTRISIPERTVLWLPVILKSLPLRMRMTGGWAAAAPPPTAPPRGAAAPGPAAPPLGAAPAPGPAGPPPPRAPMPPPPPPMFRRPISPVHTEAFQVGWILQVLSMATLSFSPSLSRT